MRYSNTGEIDSTFGINGITKTNFGGGGFAYSAAFTNDNKIAVVGTGKSDDYPSEVNVFLVARYNSNGLPDSSFGVNGKVSTGFDYKDAGYSVLVQSDNKIIVSGFKDNLAGNLLFPLIAVIRYLPDGSIDSSFGKNGLASVFINSPYDAGASSALQTDGKIIISAFSYTGSRQFFALIRFNTNGILDSSFGINGVATADVSKINGNSYSYDNAFSVAIQKDERIIQAGIATAGTNLDFGLERYNSDGSIDSTFANNGSAVTPIGNYDDAAFATKIQQDGKIVVAGYAYNGTDNDFAVVRYNNDAVLPVNFTSFVATKNKNAVLLNWNVCNETNNKGFYIQHNNTINNWTDIGDVSSNGIDKTCNDYSFTDEKPSAGNNLYRLKQVDNDGKISYSKIVNIVFENTSIKISPNPVKNILTIIGLGVNNSVLYLVNENGKVVSSSQTSNDIFNWNIQNLVAGNYFLVISQNNKLIASLKLIKQ